MKEELSKEETMEQIENTKSVIASVKEYLRKIDVASI